MKAPVDPNAWRVVISPKPERRGEAFVMRGDTFVLKVYRDSVTDVHSFARWIAGQMNILEQRQAAKQFEMVEAARAPGGQPVTVEDLG